MERRGRPSKTHRDGEERPCVHCRIGATPSVAEPSPVVETANKLVDEFIRLHVRGAKHEPSVHSRSDSSPNGVDHQES